MRFWGVVGPSSSTGGFEARAIATSIYARRSGKEYFEMDMVLVDED